MLQFWGLRLYAVLGGLLPLRLLAAIGQLGGAVAYYLLPRKSAHARQNAAVLLAACTPLRGAELERRAERLAKRQMRAYAQFLVDFASIPRLLPRVHADAQSTTGWEHLDRLVAEGRGCIIATLHFGNWDLAGAAVAGHLPPDQLYAVAEEFAHPRLNEMVVAQRAAVGMAVVPMSNVRRMVQVLREGKFLCLVVDRPVQQGDGVPVRFFGRLAHLPAGAAVLATLARCPIVPGYLRRRADGSFEGGILAPIEPVRTGRREEDLAATMQRLVEALEPVIRRAPHQWYMFRPMWPAVSGTLPAPPGVLGTGLGRLRGALACTLAQLRGRYVDG